MKTRTGDTGSPGLLADLLAGASILRKEAARLAKDADCLHEPIDRMHAAADHLHRKLSKHVPEFAPTDRSIEFASRAPAVAPGSNSIDAGI